MLKWIRIFMTGLSFVCFGIICLLGNIFFYPFMLLRLHNNKNIQYFCRFLVAKSWGFFIIITEFLRCQHSTNIKILKNLGCNGEIIISNHPSLLDVVFFLANVKNANCVVKNELKKNIFLSGAIACSGYIPNTQNEEFLNEACKVLKNGESLVIFPEGTRTKDEIIFHKAASYIAIKSAKKMTAIYIDMHPKSLKKDSKWHQVPDKIIEYKFKILAQIQLNEFYPTKINTMRARYLHNHLKEIYQKEIMRYG